MKLIAITGLLMLTIISNNFAQQEKSHVDFKNEGNEALKSNNFKKALELFESAIAVWPKEEEMDAPMVYNAATCARRQDLNEKALKLYTLSQDLNYRSDLSAYYRASALKDLGRDKEMEELLIKSVDEFKTSNVVGHMKKMLVTFYLIQGSEPYNRASQVLASAGNADPSQYAEITAKANEFFAEAKPWFEKAIGVDPGNENAVSTLKAINEKLAGK